MQLYTHSTKTSKGAERAREDKTIRGYADEPRERKKRRWGDRRYLTREQWEIEAETIAYLVCPRCGLETKAMEYVAGYLKNPEADLAAISIKVILDVGRRIEDMAGSSQAIQKHL